MKGEVRLTVEYLRAHRGVRIVLVEKTDRLYRNLKDWVTLDELDLEIHFVKESVILSPDSRSSEKFMHGIKVLMAKNYIDNLSEETRKGMNEKAAQGYWPSRAPLGYRNVTGDDGRRSIELDSDYVALIRQLFEWYATRSANSLARRGTRGSAFGRRRTRSRRAPFRPSCATASTRVTLSGTVRPSRAGTRRSWTASSGTRCRTSFQGVTRTGPNALSAISHTPG